jgi:signal transduction histidine kinase
VYISPLPHIDSQAVTAQRAANLRGRALDAQNALLPYALGFFAFGLFMFAWASSFAANAPMMTLSLLIFAINWGAFYALANAVRSEAVQSNLPRRTRLHLLGGLLWVVAINQISVFALGAGPARETLLLLSAGAAAASCFFLAPLLPSLLLLGPLAAAGPIIGLFLLPETRHMGILAAGALAAAMALALVVNRIIERQYTLGYERDLLAEACERSLGEAERLAKSKSALLATLSDEVKSGLTGVAHVLAAATGGAGRAPSREQLNAALSASRDLIEVLNATLDSETAEDGRLSVRAEPIDAERLVRDLVYLNQPMAAAKGLELAGHVDSELGGGAVSGDPVRTRQVLSNLIGNALKYTLRGRVEVRVRLTEDGRARFEVADTGPGLSREELETAFQPFTRIERTCAGATGAGVGLSLSRKLADLMGGDVAADSAVGVGSCFWLDLPYEKGASAEPKSATFAPGRPLKVLCADNDQLSAAVTRAALEELGHQVLQAANPRRAAELTKVADVDLVVLGFSDAADAAKAARLLRAAPGESSQAPILALIGGEADEAATRMAAGCTGVMRRPVTAATLARAIAGLRASAPAANAA